MCVVSFSASQLVEVSGVWRVSVPVSWLRYLVFGEFQCQSVG